MAQTVVDLSHPSKRIVPKLAHDLILGDTTRSVGQRAGVANLQAVKAIIGGFAPTLLGSATVSAQVATWRATNVVVPATGAWFVLVIDLAASRGTHLVNGAMWRRLAVASPGGTPGTSEAIPLGGGVSAGRSGGDALLVSYDQGRSGGDHTALKLSCSSGQRSLPS